MKEKWNNLPGQPQLDFRAGTYADFLRQMESLVKLPVLEDKKGEFPNPLKNLELHYQDDLAVGLFKAWAVIGDILTFYQERIANEGFIKTAADRKSILELVNAIGYTMKPGLSASTYLVFTAREKKAVAKPMTVPKGTLVQGIPEKGVKPVSFETAEDIEVRPQWNRLSTHIETQPGKHTITHKSSEICFKGTAAGLKHGQYLLVTGQDTNKDQEDITRFLRRVLQVEPVLDPKGIRVGTRVTLEEMPKTDPPIPTIENPRVYFFRQQPALFGHNAPDWHTQPAKIKDQAGTPKGGPFYSIDNGSNWNSAGKGLPQNHIRAIAVDSTGCIVVGTDKGVFRSLDRGKTWQAVNSGLSRRDVYALYFDSSDHLYMGTARGGAFRSTDRGQSWEPIQDGLVVEKEHHVKHHWKRLNTLVPNTTVRAITSYTEEKDLYIFAGTNTGIMRSVNLENIWEPASEDLPGWNENAGTANVVVHCFVKHPQESHLFAGTDKGVFMTKNHGKSWKHLDKGLPAQEVFTLAACEVPDTHKHLFFKRKAKHYLFAGTPKGVFMSDNDGDSWQPEESLLALVEEAPCVRSLVIYIDKTHPEIHLFAGTDKGLFVSNDLGETWRLEITGFTSLDIKTLAVNHTGLLLAAAPFAGVMESNWPDFYIKGNQVDLVRTRTGIIPGSWLVLKQDKPEPLVQICRAKSISHLIRTDFTRTGKILRVETEGCTGLDRFDLRETRVFAQNEELPLLKEQISITETSPGDTIKLTGLVEGLKPGQAIAITGQLASTEPTAIPRTVCEVRRISGAQISPGGEYTEILLDNPLEHEFEPATVTICANVAYATQGETVSHEILGSGNAAQPNQQFTLKKQPLTYISTAAAEGAISTLEVRVTSGPPHGYLKPMEPDESVKEKGIRWQVLDSLYNSGPLDRKCMVRIDEENNARVIFGDGDKGARLPTGIENVTATYRSSNGETGNIAVDRLVILKNRPLGIQKVTNPLPAAGGEAPETIDSARIKAPMSVRTLQRIVSISDYRDFTCSFAGIAKAHVKRLRDGKAHLVHITAAPAGGTALQKDSSLYKNLLESLHTHRAIPVPLRIDSFEPLFFNLHARVTIEADEDAEALENQVKNALQEVFSFKNRQLGWEVSAAEVIVTIQQVKGVRAVDLQALYRVGTPISLTNALQAHTAYWDPGENKIQPAQLLMINNEKDSIILKMEKY